MKKGPKALENDQPRKDVARLKRRIKIPDPDFAKIRAEWREYFTARARKREVVQTTKTPSGQTLDWVPIESQVKRGKVADPPSESEAMAFDKGKRADRVARFELEDANATRGPKGTVPIVRKNLSALRYNKLLKEYLSKHGHQTYHVLLRGGDEVEVPGSGNAHEYAYSSQSVTCYGGEGYFAAFDPYSQWSDEFSLLQIALVRGSGDNKQTVEAGWQQYRDLYGDWVPHLFVYYTTNGYTDNDDDEGGYNQDVDGWVQYSDSVYPEAVSSPNSTRGGDQYVMRIKFQLYEGNWWLRCNSNWIGYYPASLFSTSGLRSRASKVAFYGEIVDSADHASSSRTDMGSGYWPEYGWTWAAYMRNLRYQSGTGGSMSKYAPQNTWVTDANEYDMIGEFDNTGSWKSYFWLGGPGA
jgi:Neprosin